MHINGIYFEKREKQKNKREKHKTHIEYFSKPILHKYLCINVYMQNIEMFKLIEILLKLWENFREGNIHSVYIVCKLYKVCFYKCKVWK